MRRYCDFTADGASTAPDRRAIVADEGTRTFAELDGRAEQLASALRGEGLVPGDRVAWLAANELEFAEVQAGCLKGGFALVPLNWRLSVDELRYVVDNAEPQAFVHGRAEAERAHQLTGPSTSLVVGLGDGASYEDLVVGSVAEPDANPTDPELLATILYTSGTTGKPKGAMIDRLCLSSRLLTTVVEARITGNKVFLCTLPMFHIAAYMAYAYLMRGATVVQTSVPFNAERILKVMVDEAVTDVLAVPTMLHQLIEETEATTADGLQLRQVLYGGSSMAPALIERAAEAFGCDLHQEYGLTETQMLMVLQPEAHDIGNPEAIASVGRSAITSEVRIVDASDDDSVATDVPAGEVGEVICRGPSVMREYWRNPDATARAIRDGWMHTGDLAYFDPQGFLHVVDRIDDMIVSGGENVYPTEIERVLMELPAVREVAVVGVPDERWGQIVTAVILESAPPDEDLEAYVRERIANYKVPRRWVRLEEIPKNATGKIMRRALKQQLDESSA